MNLRVDLILPSEQRSGSVLSLKSIIRIVSIAIPSVILLLFGLGILSVVSRHKVVIGLLQEKEATQPLEKRAVEVRKQLADNEGTLKEINGWRASHMDWHEQLRGLQTAVPEQIQLTALKIDESFQVENVPARVYSCVADGKTRSATPQQDVELLKAQMETEPRIAEHIKMDPEGVSINKFDEDPDKDAPPNARVFTISWQYKPLKFEEKKESEKNAK